MVKAVLFLLGIVLVVGWTGECRADGVNYYLQYAFFTQDFRVTTPQEGTQKVHNQSFLQRYRLTFTRHLSSVLALNGGGIFAMQDSQSRDDSGKNETTVTQSSPYLDLSWRSYPFQAGVGFQWNKNDTSGTGVTEDPQIRHYYHAHLNWRPQNLPSLTLGYERTDTFDQNKESQDRTTQEWRLGSEYQATPKLKFYYQADFVRSQDHLSDIRNDLLSQSVRVDYRDQFFHGRTIFSGSYNLGLQNTSTVASGQGEVEVPPLSGPSDGLYGLDSSPEEGTLASNPTVSSGGADIPLVGTVSAVDDPRNIGLVYTLPTHLNTLRLWVAGKNALKNNENLNFSNLDSNVGQELLQAFSNVKVYVSTDGEQWTPVEGQPVVTLDSFQNFLEIRFNSLSTTYVKVVVAAIDPASTLARTYPDLHVTQLQATLFVPAADAVGSTSSISHNLVLNARTLLVESLHLTHTFSLNYAYNQSSGAYQAFISNGLSLIHQFKPTLLGSAQIFREDTLRNNGDQTAYRWGGNLRARPLPTIVNSLSYGGSLQQGDNGDQLTNSLYLTNRFSLYRGLSLLLNGGGSLGSNGNGQNIESYMVVCGVSITPHPSVSVNLSASLDASSSSGGKLPASSSRNNREKVSLSWTPTSALNFFLAYERVDQGSGGVKTLRNVSAGWSPFSGGALQLQVGFNESLRPESNQLNRTISQSLIWHIRRGTNLTLTYSDLKSETSTQKTQGQTFNANLIIAL